MARTKEFDPDVALDWAMELFWTRGYDATSMADLVEHVGVGRASLYATFGDKQELYLQALQRYLAKRSPDPVEVLSQPGPAVPAVRALVRQYVDDAIGDEQGRGCMVVNTAVELASRDAVFGRRVAANWDGLETALVSALTRAQAQGELSAQADPWSVARFLLVFLQGVKVVGMGSDDAERLRAAGEQALRALA